MANKRLSRPLFGVPAPDFAMHDPGTALASIFRPVCRGPRPKGLDVSTTFDGLTLRFVNFEWLDVREQSILLACCALAGLGSQEITRDAPGEIGKKLWTDLEPKERAVTDRGVVIVVSYYQLMQAAGLPTNKYGYERVKEMLFRLSATTCRAKKDGYDWSMNLLSYAARPDGTISIALNGRFADALAGQHIRTSLLERRSLPSEIAQLMHCALTAQIRKGHHQRVRLDVLAERVWGGPAREDARRKRRERIGDALRAIGQIPGWRVDIQGRGEHAMATIWHSQPKDVSPR
jgi:hypothetical protein